MSEKALVEEKVRQLYPGEPVKVLVEGGMSFACETGGNIIRVPKNEYAAIGYRIEEKILAHLAGKIKSADIPGIKIVEKPFFHTIHKKLEGLYWDGAAYICKPEKERDLLANDCAVFLTEVHAADIKKINAELSKANIKMRELQSKEEIEEHIKNYLYRDFSVNEIDKIIKFITPLYDLPEEDKCLIHNDFYYDNFFVDNNLRLKGVIDFANSGHYNYNFDFRKIVSYEEGEQDLWERIVKFYERLTNRKIDMQVIKIIDIYNYISFLTYFAKNPEISEEKIGVRDNWDSYVEHIKHNIKEYADA